MNRENVAKALRGAAEFCLDPKSPKTHGTLADRPSPISECTRICRPNDPAANRWCGVGYACHLLGVETIYPVERDYGVSLDNAINAFDDRHYEVAANHFTLAAESVEARPC